jgi:hypothetical protein
MSDSGLLAGYKGAFRGGPIADSSDPMRYLQVRSGLYRYYRRVPLILKGVDERFPFVRIALKTPDLRVAIAKRDALEHADNELWASYMGGQGVDAALARFEDKADAEASAAFVEAAREADILAEGRGHRDVPFEKARRSPLEKCGTSCSRRALAGDRAGQGGGPSANAPRNSVHRMRGSVRNR